MRKNILAFTAFIMITAFVLVVSSNTQAKVQISKKSITMAVSQKHILKLNGYNSKVNWKSSKPKVAKVSKKGVVTALKKGRANITAKIKKNRYKCVVIVKDEEEIDKSAANLPVISSEINVTVPASESSVPTPTPVPTQQPTNPTQEPTQQPNPTQEPLYPTVQTEDVLWGYYVSDIGENYIEVSDENGSSIRFDYSYSGIKVFYDAVITKRVRPVSRPVNYIIDIEGDTIEYSDIRIGDKVDIIYNYWVGDLLAEKKYLSHINVHKNN